MNARHTFKTEAGDTVSHEYHANDLNDALRQAGLFVRLTNESAIIIDHPERKIVQTLSVSAA